MKWKSEKNILVLSENAPVQEISVVSKDNFTQYL